MSNSDGIGVRAALNIDPAVESRNNATANFRCVQKHEVEVWHSMKRHGDTEHIDDYGSKSSFRCSSDAVWIDQFQSIHRRLHVVDGTKEHAAGRSSSRAGVDQIRRRVSHPIPDCAKAGQAWGRSQT